MAAHNPLITNPSAFSRDVASGYTPQKSLSRACRGKLRLDYQASMFAGK